MNWRQPAAYGISALAILLSWLLLSFEKAFAVTAFLALLFLYLRHRRLVEDLGEAREAVQELRTRLHRVEQKTDPSGSWVAPESEHLQRRGPPDRVPESGPTPIPGIGLDQVIDVFKNLDGTDDDWIMNHTQADAEHRELTPWRERSSGGQERLFTFKKPVNIPVLGKYTANTKLFFVMHVDEDRSISLVSEARAHGPPFADSIAVRCFLQFCADGGCVSAKQWSELHEIKPLGSLAPKRQIQNEVQAKAGLTFTTILQLLQGASPSESFEPNDSAMAEHPDIIDPSNQTAMFDHIMSDVPLSSVRKAMLEPDWPIDDVAKALQKGQFRRTFRSAPWTDVENGEKVRRLQYCIPLELSGYLSRFLSLPEGGGGGGQLTSWYKFQELPDNTGFKILHRMKCTNIPLLNRFLMEEITIFTGLANGSQTNLKKWTQLERTGETGAMSDLVAKQLLRSRVWEGSLEAVQSLVQKLQSSTV
eukprot:TRINITY_DN74285_c0_g1_i1.p1 TRINITY_DN74285_c0_g1~~TRINITY_DN74285_c0_g1_i1.p1  ORF type:complete len:476 (+),score=75.67 TRINITY_DN74285_c0_g1_i1:102-1529(+)